MTTTYKILSTQQIVYQDSVQGVINGVLVKFRLDPYNEVHEVRVPKMDVSLVKAAIVEMLEQRDALEALNTISEEK